MEAKNKSALFGTHSTYLAVNLKVKMFPEGEDVQRCSPETW